MKYRLFTVMLLLATLVSLTGIAGATAPSAADQPSLVFVTIDTTGDVDRFASTGLPLYAMLEGGWLTGADALGQQALSKSGLSFQVLDLDLKSGSYYLAETRPSRQAPDFSAYGLVLLHMENGVLLRMDPARVDALSQSGAELSRITLTPKPLPDTRAVSTFPEVVIPDPLIQGMIDQVSQAQAYQYIRELAGEVPVWVDNDWYTITSRYTYSGIPIQKATSYVGQQMAGLGLDVEYHQWSGETFPNVIGEIPGLVNPDDIFIIGGHLDDVQGTPGADDNASGSVATLLAAEILSQYQWGCTLRFAFWTGEEQGLNGSEAYAQRSYNAGENILGYLNLDMISWNTPSSQPGIDLLYNASMPPTLELAQLFSDAVSAYNINLIPQLVTSLGGGSDHSSFWNFGYTAILGIEDQGDFNPYYHGPGDTPAHIDQEFFTNFVKASLATYAHMSECLIPSGLGSLDGHVTASTGGAPIENALVLADDGDGHTFPTTTDASGYYTRTLLADTYTVTASAYGYLPASFGGVTIVTDTVTTQDFSLITAPTYTVSGNVTEAITGLPLLAEIEFTGSPVSVWTDPATGFYQAELPEGSYTMHVTADLHEPQQRSLVLDHSQVQNFILDPLPCILLVDDDNDSPNTTPYYTAALDSLGYEYNLFNTSGGAGPTPDEMNGYRIIIWYSGDAYGGRAGPNGSDETNLSAYLDAGGSLFLDSQDYLYDFGLTPFGQNYLGIGSHTNDNGDATSIIGITGDPIGNGLGPFPLTYPSGFTDYGDRLTAGSGSIAFRANNNSYNLDIDKDGGAWKTVFFATSWVPLYNNNSANGLTVMDRMINWFGGCEVESGWLDGHVTDAGTGSPLEGVLVTAAPGESNIQAITDPTGYYTMTLPTGTYTITAEMSGYLTQSHAANITANEVTTLDFALQSECEAVSNLDFSWLPAAPFNGEAVTFNATASGTQPIDYQWSFGDTFTGIGSTVEHTYSAAGDYTVELQAANACSSTQISKPISVLQYLWEFFLPLLSR